MIRRWALPLLLLAFVVVAFLILFRGLFIFRWLLFFLGWAFEILFLDDGIILEVKLLFFILFLSKLFH